mmetsp:Transcript_70956/g.229729  ORF Transcript_70956/g.229729 Transcript_70956/m.229729 type:complete len:303 (-) Transcript_70956:842-1750(-)
MLHERRGGRGAGVPAEPVLRQGAGHLLLLPGGPADEAAVRRQPAELHSQPLRGARPGLQQGAAHGPEPRAAPEAVLPGNHARGHGRRADPAGRQGDGPLAGDLQHGHPWHDRPHEPGTLLLQVRVHLLELVQRAPEDGAARGLAAHDADLGGAPLGRHRQGGPAHRHPHAAAAQVHLQQMVREVRALPAPDPGPGRGQRGPLHRHDDDVPGLPGGRVRSHVLQLPAPHGPLPGPGQHRGPHRAADALQQQPPGQPGGRAGGLRSSCTLAAPVVTGLHMAVWNADFCVDPGHDRPHAEQRAAA